MNDLSGGFVARDAANDRGFIPAPLLPDEDARESIVGRLMTCAFDLSELDELVAGVATLFDVPIAAATVLDRDWQYLPSKVGLDVDRTSRAVAFCGYTIAQQKPFCVPDAHKDVRFAGNPLVIGEPGIRFYAGARLIVGGMPVGSLCAIGKAPIASVDQERIVRLEELALDASAILDRQLAAPRD